MLLRCLVLLSPRSGSRRVGNILEKRSTSFNRTAPVAEMRKGFPAKVYKRYFFLGTDVSPSSQI